MITFVGDQPAGLLRNPWLTFAIICGAIISLTLMAEIIYAHGGQLGADFEVFWKAARAPVASVYVPDPFRPFVYPPSALPWFRPLALLPFWPSFIAWSICGIGLFRSAARGSWLLLVSPVVVQCVIFGQTALLLGGLLLFSAERRPLVRGALVGVVFAIKPQLVLMAPLLFAVRRDFDGFAGFVVASVGLVILSVLLYGVGIWVNWFHALPAFRHTLNNQHLWGLIVTPFGYATHLGLNPWPVFTVCAALAVAGLWLSNDKDPIELICLTSLLATPYAGGSDLTPLLPFAFRRLIDPPEPMKIWTALVYTAAFTPIAVIIGIYRLCRYSTDPGLRNSESSVRHETATKSEL